LEKSQPKERGRATEVIVGNLPKLYKTSPLMLGTLHHVGVLDFVATVSNPTDQDKIHSKITDYSERLGTFGRNLVFPQRNKSQPSKQFSVFYVI
jgi:hypothetical protein